MFSLGFFLFFYLSGLSCLQEGKQAHSEDISEVLPLMDQDSSLSIHIKKQLILLKRLVLLQILFGCLSNVALNLVCNV